MFQLGIAERKTVANVIVDAMIPKMMLDIFTEPDTVTCILCRATVSIRKGDKARFFNHISIDHEVHYDMDLFYVVSFLSEAQKDTVINIISKKFDRKEKSNNNKPKDDEESKKQQTTEIQLTDTKTSIPKKENTDLAEEVLILKPEKDPLDVEETNHDDDTNTTNIEAFVTNANDEEKCSTCDLMLPKKVMQAHINIEHKLQYYTKYTCKICMKTMNKQNYKRHMKLVHKISNSQLQAACRDQGENDSRISSHVVDESTLNKETEHTTCKLCFRTLKKSTFQRHMKLHSGQTSCRCPLCYIRFSEERGRNHHFVTVHKDEEHLLNSNREPNFSEADCNVFCPDCDRKFISETSMKWHCRIKHGSGNYQCESCKKKFKKRFMYDKHILHCLTAPSLIL